MGTVLQSAIADSGVALGLRSKSTSTTATSELQYRRWQARREMKLRRGGLPAIRTTGSQPRGTHHYPSVQTKWRNHWVMTMVSGHIATIRKHAGQRTCTETRQNTPRGPRWWQRSAPEMTNHAEHKTSMATAVETRQQRHNAFTKKEMLNLKGVMTWQSQT